MENRLERLEAKVKSLSTTARVLGLFGRVLTGLAILALVLGGGMVVALYLAEMDLGPEAMDTIWANQGPVAFNIIEGGVEMLVLGWVLRQLRDTFAAIVDIIGELSETV
jgi:hypothetical protein